MKVVIPVAGKGTRLKPHTFSTPKCLMNVAGKPILGHILDTLNSIKDNISEIIFVTGYMGLKIRSYIKSNCHFKTRFVEQKEPKGLGHAIKCASSYFDDSPVLIILGDTIIDFDITKLINSSTSILGVKKVETNARAFGVAFANKNGKIKKLIEKPDLDSGLALVGLYFIKNGLELKKAISSYIASTVSLKTKEYQLTDILQKMIENKHVFFTININGWFDCGNMNALLETNRYLLQRKNNSVIPNKFLKCNIINMPVDIHTSCDIKDSIIGPYVTISAGAKITRCQLTDSIIETNAIVSECVLDKSIIGANSILKGKRINLNIGDSSIVELG